MAAAIDYHVTMDSRVTLLSQQSAISKLNRALLPICCLMIGFCYLDRSNIAYAAISLRKPPPVGINMTDVTYGKGSGSFFIGYALFQIPSNLVLVRLWWCGSDAVAMPTDASMHRISWTEIQICKDLCYDVRAYVALDFSSINCAQVSWSGLNLGSLIPFQAAHH